MELEIGDTETVGVIVAHPDDETLWTGGTLLLHPRWHRYIYTVCRASDTDRSPKFSQALAYYHACGAMADLDDSPEQPPLDDDLLAATILRLLGGREFDLLFTHGPRGEYTRHLRHEETSRAVRSLWAAGAIQARCLCLFAYEDGARAYYPRARTDADVQLVLPSEIWKNKFHLIHEIYRFSSSSWEAQTTPRTEAFWCFKDPERLHSWLQEEFAR